MHGMYRKWLAGAFKDSGKSHKSLADHLRLDPSAVTRMLNGERQIKSNEVPSIASFFQVALPKGFGNADIYSIQEVRVDGVISGGVWRDTSITSTESEALPIIQQGGNVKKYALRVEGDSVNLFIKDGSYAICVPYWEVRSEIQDGDLVHVERTRGGLIEATIKRVKIVNGAWELQPESNNLEHSTPIKYDEDGTNAVEIKGLVIAEYSKLGRL